MADKWDERADVVIIGSGFAGLAAADRIKRSGGSVSILEKMNHPGGNSIISDGALAAAGSGRQAELGIEDSPELMTQDMLAAGLGLNRPELVRLVAERSSGVFDWCLDYLQIRFMDQVDRFGGHSAARSLTTHNNSGAPLVKAQLARLKEMGCPVRTGCLLTRILTDDQGAAVGVEYRQGYRFPDPASGSPRLVRADKAVILASGGFGGDIAFRTAQDPRLGPEIDCTTHPGSTAEGLAAALRLGAMPVHLSHIQLGPWASPDERGCGAGASFASYAVFPRGLVVDPLTGRRIVNELADRRRRAEAIIETGRACLGLVDSRGARAAAHLIRAVLQKGVVREFGSLGEMAAAYDLPQKEFIATVDRFNQGFGQGVDQDWGKPLTPEAAPLDKPPFYAIRLWPKVHYTMGGAAVDDRARVLDLEGKPIPRFLAAGEVTGGIHGACRLGSCAITECLVFGRIAGQEASDSTRAG